MKLTKDYTISNNGLIQLKQITETFRCPYCNKTLAVQGTTSLLLYKNTAAIDFTTGSAHIKCTQCKEYIEINVKKNKNVFK